VAFAPHDDVGLVEVHQRQEGGEQFRGEITVRIEEAQIAAAAEGQADLEGLSLPAVLGQFDVAERVVGEVGQ
jgi:hypothetical protein